MISNYIITYDIRIILNHIISNYITFYYISLHLYCMTSNYIITYDIRIILPLSDLLQAQASHLSHGRFVDAAWQGCFR